MRTNFSFPLLLHHPLVFRPNRSSSLPCSALLNSCSSLPDLKRLHAFLLTGGLAPRLALATKLISLAAALSPTMDYARALFDETPCRDSFLWNTLIRGYSCAGPCTEVPLLYSKMHRAGFSPDHFTFPFVIRSCSVISAIGEGRQAHCNVLKNGFDSNVFAQSSLIAMYFQSGEIHEAELVFCEMGERTIVSWTAMVAGYAQNRIFGRALSIFNQMIGAGAQPNEITLASVLPACRLCLGRSIHGFVIKSGLSPHLSLTNALVAMYGRCGGGTTQAAKSLFEEMPARSSVSWNTMIAAHVQNGDGAAAVRSFRRMMTEKISIDSVTLISVISACAGTGNLEVGRWVHEVAKKRGLDEDARIGNALLDMYAKCGKMDSARDLFQKLGPAKSVVSWSTMIGAYAAHGHGEEALSLFSKMKEERIAPNSFTFTSVLAACSRSGLVKEGIRQFDSMKREYGISPAAEHCACMVDLLGRAGRIGEAYEFIKRMETKPDKAVWGALLGACRMHGDVEMAELAGEDALRSDAQNVTLCVLMANMYADAGRWEDAARMREKMRELEMKKAAGFSLVGGTDRTMRRNPVSCFTG